MFLWGDVVEYDEGWRAAAAYPEHLLVAVAEPGRAEQVRATILVDRLRAYGVPVELLPWDGDLEAALTLGSGLA